MRKNICDRCGMPTGDTYYTIEIYASSDKPGKTVEECAHNMNQNFRHILRGHREYCKECKDEIEKYMETGACKITQNSGRKELKLRPPVKEPPEEEV